MKNMKVQVQCECPACHGTGTQRNPDHDPADIPFPENALDTCQHCQGNKTVTEFISVEHFLQNIADLDIQF